MFEKYIKIIEDKKSQKDIIQNFLEKEIGLSDFNFDVVGEAVKIECSSQDRFILKMKEGEVKKFLAENKLRLKKYY